MGPKVRAAVRFLRSGGEVAIITTARHALSALEGRHGTRIVPAPAAVPEPPSP
jgi:carbamate kinase